MLQRITHPQGADRDYDFAVTDAQGAENVSGWTFSFTVWRDLEEAPEQLFELTSAAGGIVVDNAVGGIGRIRVLAATVADLEPGRYRFELGCVRGSGKPDVLAAGTFVLVPQPPAA